MLCNPETLESAILLGRQDVKNKYYPLLQVLGEDNGFEVGWRRQIRLPENFFFSGQLFLFLEAGAPVVFGGWVFSSCAPGRGRGLSQQFQGPEDTPAFTTGYGDLALMVHTFHALCRLCLAPGGSQSFLCQSGSLPK